MTKYNREFSCQANNFQEKRREKRRVLGVTHLELLALEEELLTKVSGDAPKLDQQIAAKHNSIVKLSSDLLELEEDHLKFIEDTPLHCAGRCNYPDRLEHFNFLKDAVLVVVGKDGRTSTNLRCNRCGDLNSVTYMIEKEHYFVARDVEFFESYSDYKKYLTKKDDVR